MMPSESGIAHSNSNDYTTTVTVFNSSYIYNDRCTHNIYTQLHNKDGDIVHKNLNSIYRTEDMSHHANKYILCRYDVFSQAHSRIYLSHNAHKDMH